ncbi:MAG: cytochrome c biogenesis heme-transporting ATPase CcmA [Henriciella sp.]
MTENNLLLQASQLGAMRGERLLFRGLDLQLTAGETVLLRGLNGSGKTTLLRQLCGLSDLHAGTVRRLTPHHWVSHSNGLKAHETPRTHLQHWARVWGSTASVEDILTRIEMTRPADVPCQMLSAGQKRRTALGRLLLEDRQVWMLDEPFSGLDDDGEALLTELIETHCAKGGAVIVALHGESPVTATREVTL